MSGAALIALGIAIWAASIFGGCFVRLTDTQVLRWKLQIMAGMLAFGLAGLVPIVLGIIKLI